MEKENQTIEELKDKKIDLNKQFEVRRAAVQAKERFNQLLQRNKTFYVVRNSASDHRSWESTKGC